jgi:signal transduction histidine kinase/FixJ family two-component response regulator
LEVPKIDAKILISYFPGQKTREFCAVLRSAGYEVTESDSRAELKKILDEDSFNLILMDHDPRLEANGSMLSYVKKRYPGTLVILLSEEINFDSAIGCIRQGAYDYLIHPVSEDRLLEVIRRSLERQQLGMLSKANAKSLEEKVIHLQQLTQRMAALYKIVRDTRGLSTIEDSIRKVMDYLGEAIDMEACFCVLVEKGSLSPMLKVTLGHPNPEYHKIMEQLGAPPEAVIKAFERGDSLSDVSLVVEKEILHDQVSPEQFRQIIITPMVILKNIFGFLCLFSPGGRPYTFADRQMVSIVASQAVHICEENHNLMQSSQLITMGTLTSELAHDLKNPLANIKGILQTLDGKWERDEVRDPAMKMIDEEMNRADNLVAELLSFARNQELEIRYWNVHDLLEKALMISKNTLSKARIEVVKNFNPESLMIWTNENELIDAFVNIIVNAAQAMADGGTLTINTRLNLHKRMANRDTPIMPHRYVQIEFTDTGIGMTRWEMDRIFERFYTTKESGTGLGLSIVDRVIKKYQGFIDVKSAKGEGTSFQINIPQR